MVDEKTTYQMTMARTENYWISPDVLYLTLNAMGQPDYLQGNVSSGAVIMCYIRSIEGLSYDAGHNYRRWPLAVSPTYFNTSTAKYVYVAIPKSDAVNAYAQVVFPSEQIDIYGKNAEGKQVASDQYYFIFLQGIISASIDADGATQMRTWSQRIDCGSLASDEALAAGGADSWWQYSSVDDTITFLKTITKAVFDNLTAKVATITKIILGGKPLTGIAQYPTSDANSETEVVTPKYVNDKGNQEYLSKTHDDTTEHKLTMGEAEVKRRLTVGNDVKSSGFLSTTESTTPQGWALRLLDAIATGELDDLIVRRDAKVKDLTVTGAAHFFKLIIDEIKSAGGSVLHTPANGFVAENVTHHGTAGGEDERYILYWKDSDGEKTIDNQWQVGDFAVCMTANLKQGVSHNAGNKTWWCKVVDSGNAGGYNYISLDWYGRAQGKTITEGGKTFTEATSSGVPEKGDNVAMLGSVATDKDGNFDYKRQSAIYLAAYDSLDMEIETPFLAFYYGIDDFCLSRHRKTHLSRLATNVFADKFTVRSDDEEYPLSVFFGDWNSETTYPKAGVVSYNGCTWTSLKDGNKGNTPSSSSEWWVSNKGEKGDYIDIAFKLNGTEVGSLDYKAIKEMGTATFEVDFTNDGMEYNAAKATLGCYDGEGNLLGSEIVSTDTSNIVADCGNLYLSKDCRTILCTIYDATGKKVRAEGIAVIYVEDGADATSIRMELRTTPFADMYHEGDSYNATFTLVVFETKGGNDPTDITSTIPTTRFRWTRTTKRGGSSDTGWNDIHANVGPVLTLTEKDLDGDTYFLGELLSADGTKTLKAVSMNI